MRLDTDELLDRIPALCDRRAVEELPGGLTNLNLKVTTGDGVFVVRTAHSDAGLLGIDREAEHGNSVRAWRAGVAPEVVDFRPDLPALVIRYVEGTTLDNGSFADPGVVTRAAKALRTLHAGPRFVNDFDMFARQAAYAATVRERGFWLPEEYADHAGAWARVREVLTRTAGPTVPCNNDLLAGNFIDDGERVWLIDYEYSGNNDPCFELGNTVTECELDEETTAALVEAYAGRVDRSLLARVRLGALCSEYGWSLWGFIQAATSPLDYDFRDWGLHRYEKAARTFTSSGFDRLLTEAGGD